MRGERLYQALIDLVAEEHRDFDEIAEQCGFKPEVLLACFDGAPNVTHEELFDHLGREQIQKVARVLNCSQMRVLIMAGVVTIAEIKVLDSGMHGEPESPPSRALKTAVRYAEDLAKSSAFGSVQRLMDEFIAATFSKDLQDACQRVHLPYKRMKALADGEKASLRDFAILNDVASALGTPLTAVLMSAGVIEMEDLMWNGALIDPMEELKAALEIEIW